jgi:hypothetical protein
MNCRSGDVFFGKIIINVLILKIVGYIRPALQIVYIH